MKESFILYTEYAEHLELLTMEQRGILFTAIMAYEMDTALPAMDACVKMAFSFIRANLDRTDRKYNEIKTKRAAAGIASGEARRKKREQTGTNQTPDKSVEQTATNPTVNVNENVNVNGNDKKSKRFAPPTVEEVAAYCKERGNTVSPERFVDFYAAKGWKVGNQSMKDWKAAVRTWEGRDRIEKQTRKDKNKFNQFEQRQIGNDDLERMLVEGYR